MGEPPLEVLLLIRLSVGRNDGLPEYVARKRVYEVMCKELDALSVKG